MKIICLMGPTAIGKTAMALELASRFPIEIVSVDSAMVYRGLDIGTAKPSVIIRNEFPHYLIDICSPAQTYSAAQFCIDALGAIKKIHARGRVPLLVGGTMLYFRALQQGLAILPSANIEVRAQLMAEGIALGWPALHERLAKIDAQAAMRIHPHDRQRIQRALEVYYLTGKNLTQWQTEQARAEFETDEIINWIVVPRDRALLHTRIAARFTQMLVEGLVEEVIKLYHRGDLNLELPSMRSVGYRQVWQYLSGEFGQEAMRERAIIATCQLAKRQLTWLRHWPNAHNFFLDEKGDYAHIMQQAADWMDQLF